MLEINTQIFDARGGLDAIYMGFVKPFDSVPHQRLLRKMRGYGLDGSLNIWTKALLTYKHQRIIVHEAKSLWSEVISGIPQSELLFIIIIFVAYINDLPAISYHAGYNYSPMTL